MRNQNTYYSVVPDHNFVCTLYFEAKNWFLERVFMVALELYGWLPNLVLQFNRSQQEEEGSSRLDYKSKRTEMHSQFLTVFLERRDRAAPLGRKFWFASASPLLTLERLDSPLSNGLLESYWVYCNVLSQVPTSTYVPQFWYKMSERHYDPSDMQGMQESTQCH